MSAARSSQLVNPELARMTLKELAATVERFGLDAVYAELARRRAAGRDIGEPWPL